MEVIELHIDKETNIEYKLFINKAGKYCVRVFDLDGNDTYAHIICISEAQARIKYQEALTKF